MNPFKTAAAIKTGFSPKIGRVYHADNYTLSFSPLNGLWRILLDGTPVISESDPNFSEIRDCFDWKPWKVKDTVEVEDYAEFQEKQSDNLYSFLACQYIELPVSENEIREELVISYRDPGWYSELKED